MSAVAPRPRILLTGGTGQIGWEIQRALAPLGQVLAPSSRELNLTDSTRLRDTVRQLRPRLIVNAAAYTAVDAAETDVDAAHALNAVAPGVLAEEAARLGAPIVHYSTDYVFDGRKATPYREDDAPNPLNVYGRTKLAGEIAVAAAGEQHLIFRTSWVYGLRGKNFLLTIRRLAAEREELRIVDDQWGAPTWCRAIAGATAEVLSRLLREDRFELSDAQSGLYHLTARGETTWCRFARAIIATDPTLSARRAVTVHAISTAEYPTPAMRPARSVLSSERLMRQFGTSVEGWDGQLEDCVSRVERM